MKTLYPEITSIWDYDKNSDNDELNKMNGWNSNEMGVFVPENILSSGRNLHAFFMGSDKPKYIHNVIKRFKKSNTCAKEQ